MKVMTRSISKERKSLTFIRKMFENRVKTMEQIDKLLSSIFDEIKTLDLQAFNTMIETQNSDLFVNVS